MRVHEFEHDDITLLSDNITLVRELWKTGTLEEK